MKPAPRPPIPPDHAERGLPDSEARQALVLALRTLEMAQPRQQPADMTIALDLVARSLKAHGALAAAEGYLLQARHWAMLLPGHDALVDLECALAELACAQAEAALASGDDARTPRNARERARAHAFAAAALAGQTSDGQWEVKVLLRISDVLDRCGDHDDAASMQNRAISLMGLNAELAEVSALQEATVDALLMAPGSNLLM
jgi:hypothetical protein